MRNILRCVLSLMAVCCTVGVSVTGEAPAPPKPPPLACTIRGTATIELGAAPTVSVEITNWTDADIYLVGSLDASDVKWRFPHCYFEVIGPSGKSAVQGIGRCGLMNPLREKDFVKVPRGGKFDPYRKIDGFGFFSAYQLSPTTFQAAGDYRIRFIYSTDCADIKRWQGSDTAKEPLAKLLSQVPRTTVSSNEIIMKVVPAKK